MKTILTYRNAIIDDLDQIVAIYNSTIASRRVTADVSPVSVESKLAWFEAHQDKNRPLWVVENDLKETIGWVSFQSFYGRPAYNATAEISIYLSEKHRGKGIGKQVLEHSLSVAPSFEIKTLLAFIFAHNSESLKLFYHFGFETWGHLPKIALLDTTERDLMILGKRIG